MPLLKLPGEPPEVRERRDFSPAGVAAALALIVLLLAAFLGLLSRAHPGPPLFARAPAPELPAGTPLAEAEFESGALREKFYAPQRARLETYGWVVRGQIARIPLTRAMAIEAAREGAGP